MERNINMNEISDGKRYTSNDLVKADCGGCEGCSACCRGMGSSIVLDPYDLYRLSLGLSLSFDKLMEGRIELNVVDGIILPDLKMTGEEECCSFLDNEGRCSIHAIRPGFCRLFPLGRLYENRSFKYFLQIHECPKEKKTKVKVKKWLDTPDFAKYETFINDWHYFLKDVAEGIKSQGFSGKPQEKQLCLLILNLFYRTSYQPDRDFYSQFYERLEEGKKVAASLNLIENL